MPKLLVIDDDVSILAWLEAVMTQADYSIECHQSDENVLESLSLGYIDLVLIDYHLEGRSGLDVLRNMRANKCTLPVIILTADYNQQVAIECFRAGASDFITKPLDPDYLKLIVKRTLEENALPLKSALLRCLGYTQHKEHCSFHENPATCDCGLADIYDISRKY